MFWLAEDGGTVLRRRRVSTGQDWRNSASARCLFVVGDPKQSIYRFRRALDIYNMSANASATRDGRVLPLTLNFRSAPQLCNWANDVFRPLFPVEPTVHALGSLLSTPIRTRRSRRRLHADAHVR